MKWEDKQFSIQTHQILSEGLLEKEEEKLIVMEEAKL